MPQDDSIDVFGWWPQLGTSRQMDPNRILKDGRDTSRTGWNWWEACGYLVTQLLRHGKEKP